MNRRPVVLVADDEQIIAQTLVQILRLEGYEAASVSDGAAAVHWVRQRTPDVLVCDVIMPTLNGIDAAKQIRTLLPNLKIILFSGQAETTRLVQQAKAEGYDFDVLAKPVKPDVLLGMIKRLTAEDPARQEQESESKVVAD